MKSLVRLSAILAALVVVSSSGLQGQGWTAGFKAGMGKGAFTGASEFAWSPTAMNVGVYFNRALTPRVSFQPEFRFAERVGHSIAGASLLTFVGEDVNLPMLLRLSYPPHHNFTPFVIGGPSLTFRADCSLQLVVAGQVTEFGCEPESFLSRLDVGLVAGYGVSRMFGATTVSVEARGNVDLRSIAKPDGSGYGRTVGWSVMMGASMPLRRAPSDSATCSGRVPCQRPPLVAASQSP